MELRAHVVNYKTGSSRLRHPTALASTLAIAKRTMWVSETSHDTRSHPQRCLDEQSDVSKHTSSDAIRSRLCHVSQLQNFRGPGTTRGSTLTHPPGAYSKINIVRWQAATPTSASTHLVLVRSYSRNAWQISNDATVRSFTDVIALLDLRTFSIDADPGALDGMGGLPR